MAITVIASASNGSSTGNNVTTSGIDTTGASLLVVVVAAEAAVAISDSKSNSWTSRTQYSNSTGVRAYLLLRPVQCGQRAHVHRIDHDRVSRDCGDCVGGDRRHESL